MGHGIACTQGNKGYLFFAKHIDNFGNIGSHQHYVYAKGLVGELLSLAHLFTSPVHGATAATNDASATGVRNGCCQHCITGPGHTALNNGIFNT